MSEKYIATFFSHFGAVRFRKELMKLRISGAAKPVPRALSSSCGTCVEFCIGNEEKSGLANIYNNACLSYTNGRLHINDRYDEIEQVVKVLENGFVNIYGSAQ